MSERILDSQSLVAMVLAAGRGKRLRPLSSLLPKPALPLPGGPVVTWGLRQAAAAGAERIVVNTWWQAETMERAARSAAPPGVDLVFSHEEELMETAGGLALARERGLLEGEGPVLVVNGDGVLGLDLDPLFARHAEGRDDVTLALLPHLDPKCWSRVILDAEGFVSAIRAPGPPEVKEVPLLYPGVMLVSRRALDALAIAPAGTASALWGPAMKRGRMGGVVTAGHWREVGTPRDYLDAALALLGDGPVIEEGARVHPEAHVGRAYAGDGVEIAASAVVGDSVLSHGVSVGSGARVLRSVVLGRLEIAAGETVIDAFLAEEP